MGLLEMGVLKTPIHNLHADAASVRLPRWAIRLSPALLQCNGTRNHLSIIPGKQLFTRDGPKSSLTPRRGEKAGACSWFCTQRS